MPPFRWDEPAEILPMSGNPAPPGGAVGYCVCGGARLRVGVYAPPGKARGTVLVMTGYSEFLEKYFETIRDLQSQGFAAVLMEWRGHGLSVRALKRAPARLHLRDLDQNIADLEEVWARVMPQMPRPFFGLGHSMGGQIALRTYQRHPDWFAALSLSAPMLGLAAPAFALHALEIWAYVWGLVGWDTRPVLGGAPSRRAGEIADNQVTTDGARFARNEGLMQVHPALMVNQISLGTVRAMMRAMRRSKRPGFLEGLARPIMIGLAGEEKIVSNDALEKAAARLPQAELKRYAGARHEILMERDEIRRAFLRDTIAFFLEHAS